MRSHGHAVFLDADAVLAAIWFYVVVRCEAPDRDQVTIRLNSDGSASASWTRSEP